MFKNINYIIYDGKLAIYFYKIYQGLHATERFSVDGKKFHSKELLFSLQYVSQAGINLINMRKPLANSYNYITTE